MTIFISGEHLALYGSRNDLTGEDSLSLEPGDGAIRLQLLEGDQLACFATWEDGSPAVDVPLMLAWDDANSTGLHPKGTTTLGRTDALGRLTFPGWARTVRAVFGEVVEHRQVGRVGPMVLGAPAAFVPVLAEGRQQLVIRVPRFVPTDFQATDATGLPIDWSRLPLTVSDIGEAAVLHAVLAEGRARLDVVAGASVAWRLDAGRDAHGEGRVEVQGDSVEVALRCQDVVRVVGRIQPPGQPLRLELQGRGRPDWSLQVEASAEGHFDLPVSRHDGVRQFAIVVGGETTLVDLPLLDTDRVDVGVVILNSSAFALLDIRDELGATLEHVDVQASSGGRAVPCRLSVTQRGHEVQLPVDVAAAVLVLSSPGRREEQVELHRGERRQVVLAAIAEVEVQVRVLPEVDASSVWVRVSKRWSMSRQEFVLDGQWAPLQKRDGRGSVTLVGAKGERCQLQVWSLKPPSVVTEIEGPLGADGLELDATRLRTITTRVDASGADYVAAIESVWLGGDWLSMVRLPCGEDRWTLPADEAAVIVAAPGSVPLRVPVAGASIHARLMPLPSTGVLCQPTASEIVGVVPSVLTKRRVRTFAGTSLPEFHVGFMSDLAKFAPLPVDHIVNVAGEQRVAHWRGTTWKIE